MCGILAAGTLAQQVVVIPVHLGADNQLVFLTGLDGVHDAGDLFQLLGLKFGRVMQFDIQ